MSHILLLFTYPGYWLPGTPYLRVEVCVCICFQLPRHMGRHTLTSRDFFFCLQKAHVCWVFVCFRTPRFLLGHADCTLLLCHLWYDRIVLAMTFLKIFKNKDKNKNLTIKNIKKKNRRTSFLLLFFKIGSYRMSRVFHV